MCAAMDEAASLSPHGHDSDESSATSRAVGRGEAASLAMLPRLRRVLGHLKRRSYRQGHLSSYATRPGAQQRWIGPLLLGSAEKDRGEKRMV